MFKKFLVYSGHLALYIVIFLGLVWFLLDIEPKEAWKQSVENVQRRAGVISGFFGNMAETGRAMNETSNYHLGQAQDRINGIDPYEKDAKKFNDQVRDYVNQK